MSRQVEIQITVGRFALRVGSPHGTRVEPAAKGDGDRVEALGDAVAAVPMRVRW
jgi:hypothetical protein